MRIESIEIKNFRQLKNLKIEFPKKNKSKQNDLHIIMGNNGVGKTNILNAITWCLYNDEMHLGDQDTASYRINDSEVMNLRNRKENNGTVSVTLKISTENNPYPAIFKREQRFNIQEDSVFGLISTLTVTEFGPNGYEINSDPETTQYLVNKYAPISINEYIFFDGEHLEHYFQEGEKGNIKDGINKLTQIDIIDRAIKAYQRYIKSEIDPLLRNNEDSLVASIQSKIEDKEDDIKKQKNIISEIKNQISTCEQIVKDSKNIIKGNENLPEKIKQLEEIEKEIKVLEKEKKNKMLDLYTFCQKYYHDLALYPAYKQFYKYIKGQENAGNLPPRIDKKLINEILQTHKCSICNTKLDNEALRFVKKIQECLEVSSEVSALLNQAMPVMEYHINNCKEYKTNKEKIFHELDSIEEKIKNKNEAYKEINNYISSIPQPESITQAIIDLNEAKSDHNKLLISLGAEQNILSSYKDDLEQLKKELQKATDNDEQLKHIKNKKSYCEQSQVLLEQIKKEILKECLKEMEDMTFEIFSKLIWKKDIFKSVEISENFDFKLINKYNQQSLGSCSAAERALLALSFTLALQHSSNHDSMLFIDTPIGRVDKDNRDNFIHTLLDISKQKQVILTFTSTEYDDNVRALLHDQYISFSHLQMTDNNTTLKDNEA